jgi:uncharacterized protein (TIGR02466 family)
MSRLPAQGSNANSVEPRNREDADNEHRRFIDMAAKAGDLLLWEGWLRHEVTVNRAATSRVSISFNYRI